MNNKPKMSIENAIECLEDLSSALTSNCEDKDIKELKVAIAMGIRALRLTPLEDIYNINL